MKTILSTKKLTEKLKVKLENKGFLVIEKKFIKTKTLKFSIENLNENLIFTSKNAVKSVLPFKNEIISRKVFCVGSKTKKLLEKNGFEVITSAENAKDLAENISQNFSSMRFTFFCGTIRKATLPQILKKNNIELNEIVVYKTVLKPHKIETKIDGILFFSPSAVESFLKENRLNDTTCFCIGNTTAESLKNKTDKIIVSKKATIEALIKKCIKYYKK
ncbi:MAG: uroporphyrinogen-III synthase [Flavobacterium haoranii]